MQKPSAQKSVGAVGQFTMTVFLWHMTAILLVAVVAWGTGNWPEAPDINGSRWAVKPLWLALIGVVLALLVLLFRRVEAWPTAETLHKSRRRALTGVALSLAGITWIGLHGLDPSDVPVRISLAMVGVLFVGMWMLDATPPRMRRRPAATGEPVEAAE
jgi:FtsH-binding integral membrane protein